MRHIFFVQSNLSALVCKAIIERLEIDASDVVFLLSRGINGPEAYQSFAVSRNLRFPFSASIFRILKNRARRREVEREFAAYTQGEDFEFYVNRMNYDFLELVQSMDGFKSLNLYEEGLAAYHRELAPDPPPPTGTYHRLKLNFVRVLSGYAPMRQGRSFYSDGYHSVFATSEKAFRNFPRRRIVDLEAVVRDLADQEDYPEVPIGSLICVLPLPYAFTNNPSARSRLLSALAEIIESSGDRSVLLKPHPDVDGRAEFWGEFFGELSDRTGSDVGSRMCPDLHLEGLAIARKDVVFCIGVSSLGAYARMLDIKLISFAPLVLGYDHSKVVMMRRVSEGLLFWEEPDQFSELLLTVCGLEGGRS